MNGLFQQIQSALQNPNGAWGGQQPPIQPQWPQMAPPPAAKEQQKQQGGGMDIMQLIKSIGSLFGG